MMTDSVKVKRSAGSPRSGSGEVEFTLVAPQAKQVCIAGQFNGWDPRAMPMKKGKDGVWKIALKLPRGKCEYKYVVDGSWVNEVESRESAPNPFGTNNCVVTIQ